MLARYITWADYKISKPRKRELSDMCRNPDYKYMVRMAAYLTEPFIAEWLIISVTEHKTYEDIEFSKMGRIPIGRTDFYGIRRRFYHIFSNMVQKY